MRRFTFDRRYAVESLKAYLFLLPSLVVLSIFVFWPIGFSLVLSFFKWDFKHQKNPVFIGWENYAKLFRLEGMPFNFLNSLLLSLSFLALGLLILFSVRLYFKRRKYCMDSLLSVDNGLLINLTPATSRIVVGILL